MNPQNHIAGCALLLPLAPRSGERDRFARRIRVRGESKSGFGKREANPGVTAPPAPNPPFGHLLPASGEKNDCCCVPRP